MAKKTIETDTPLSYKELQQLNSLQDIPLASIEEQEAFIKSINLANAYKDALWQLSYNPNPLRVYSPFMQKQTTGGQLDYWGRSIFDESTATAADWESLQDIRAENLPWLAKAGAGILKGAGLAATTFVDGTMGLLTGIGEGLYEMGLDIVDFATDQETHEGDRKGTVGNLSYLWDNEISNGMHLVNQALEDILPNYRTAEEEQNPWYKNLGTVNFWADSFIKNLGFTVGAFYSGSALTKGLQALGAVNTAMGARIVGSVLSAVNEGRIEANNNVSDWKKLLQSLLLLDYNKRYLEILANSDNVDRDLVELDNNYLQELLNIEQRGYSMGLTDLIGNTVFLSLNNFATIGKLYQSGFRGSRASWVKALEGLLNKEAGTGITGDITSGYVYNVISGKKAFARAMINPLLEGHEEIALAFISDFAGNMESYDSPDAYYKALIDPESLRKTKDVWASTIEGFTNTYGNIDRYEEFAVGFLTGLLGVPTFGKTANSRSETWLGNNRTFGISGGVIGELLNISLQNKEGQEAVAYMNRYREDLQANLGKMVQSQSFTNAMDGFVLENNAFEYNNAKDNDTFTAIARFAKVGKLEDLKKLVNDNMVDLSDEEIDKVAMFTEVQDFPTYNPLLETYVDANGAPVSLETLLAKREEVRSKLQEKSNKILGLIDLFNESYLRVSARNNGVLNDNQIEELAWLDWKQSLFADRFTTLKDEKHDFINTVLSDILNWYNSTEADLLDLESDEGKTLANNMRTVYNYFSALNKADNPLLFAHVIKQGKDNKVFLWMQDIGFDLLEGKTGLTSTILLEGIETISDMSNIALLADLYNTRLKEFMSDPNKLLENRLKLEDLQELINTVRNNISTQDKILNSSVSLIRQEIESGNTSVNDINAILRASLNGPLTATQQAVLLRVQEAQNLITTLLRLELGIRDAELNGQLDNQTAANALMLILASGALANSVLELLDTASEAYTNPNNIFDETNANIQAILAAGQDPSAYLDVLVDRARSAVENIKALIAAQDTELEAIPDNVPVITLGDEVMSGSTGADATSTIPSLNTVLRSQAEAAANEETTDEASTALSALESLNNPEIITEESILALGQLFDNIDTLKANDATVGTIELSIKATESYSKLKDVLGELNINLLLNNYINGAYTATPVQVEQAIRLPREENPVTITPAGSADLEIQSDVPVDYNKVDVTSTQPKDNISYSYWKPTTTEIPIYALKGDFTPFHDIVSLVYDRLDGKEMTLEMATKADYYINNWDKINPTRKIDNRYSELLLNRMRAVHNYLSARGTFNLVNSGAVKALTLLNHNPTRVGFMIDPLLNKLAGETVILMTNELGRIIGDVMSKNDAVASRLNGLLLMIEIVEEAFSHHTEDTPFVYKDGKGLPITTTVNKNMIGKVPYQSRNLPLNTLNAIHTIPTSTGNSQVEFKLGIALTAGNNPSIGATPGRTKKQGKSELELNILPPLLSTVGLPFLLMPSSGKYVCVPFVMPKFNESNRNSLLGKAIVAEVNKIQTLPKDRLIGVSDALLDLIAVNDIFIQEDNLGNIVVNVKPTKNSTWLNVYRGAKNNSNLPNIVLSALEEFPFLISRKYINSTYNGLNYNRMIGELATTNLPIGATHTINDWFTIKPLDATNKPTKSAPPISTGNNPNHITKLVPMELVGGKIMYYNPETTELTYEGRPYTAKDANKYKALGHGIHTNLDINKPIDTPWGWFDRSKFDFIPAPQLSNNSIVTNITALLGNSLSGNLQFPILTSSTELLVNVDLATLEKDIYISGGVGMLGVDTLFGKATDLTPFGEETATYIASYSTEDLTNENPIKFIDGSQEPTLSKAGTVIYVLERPKTAEKGLFTGTGREDVARIAIKEKLSEDLKLRVLLYLLLQRDRTDNNVTNKLEEYNAFKEIALNIYSIIHLSATSLTTQLESSQLANIQAIVRASLPESLGKLALSSTSLLILTTTPNANMAAIIGASLPLNTITKPATLTLTSEQSKQLAKLKGLLTSKKRENIWEALTPELLNVILNKKGPALKLIMQLLDVAYNGTTFDIGKLSGFAKTLFSRTSERKEPYVRWNLLKELRWLKRALPLLARQDAVNIVENLKRFAGTDFDIYGMFRNGLIYIDDDAATGTLYHEAFHSVVHTLLSPKEILDLFEKAMEKYSNLTNLVDLEERLAEDFRLYTLNLYRNREEAKGIKDKFRYYFNKLKTLINILRGKEPYLDSLFFKINNNRYMFRKLRLSSDTLFNSLNDIINQLELDDIKAKAIANGTFMKAPNGKPTNLTERQWLQVRTKAFKDWFGDWENNPTKASKIVDENGEPKIFYHYTDKEELNEFDPNFDNYFTTQKNGTHNAFFFTEQQSDGLLGRDKELAVFLNIRDLEVKHGTKDELRATGEGFVATVNRVADEKEGDYNGVMFTGFDDNRKTNQTVIVATRPNQIKSATNNIGYFDSSKSDIRYSSRGVYEAHLRLYNLKRLYNIAKEIRKNSPTSSNRTDIEKVLLLYLELEPYLKSLLYIYQLNNNGKFAIGNISLESYDEVIRRALYSLDRAYEYESLLYSMPSMSEEFYRRATQNRIESYMYSNLNSDDLEYLEERGITKEEYNRMSPTEKEVLMRCKA